MENPIITSIKRSELDDNDFNMDSGGSADEDEHDFTDADAAIDRMLDELQDFTFELEGNSNETSGTTYEPLKSEPKSPKSPTIPTVTSSLDHLRFSTIAIEDSPDVDLDALLEDLCSMERDIMSNVNDSGISSNSSMTISSSSTMYSDSVSSISQSTGKVMSPKTPLSPKSPVPANVTSDVRDRLENLQEETRELTPEEQEARFKAEKIKIALEKMKAASVQKLVVKVFEDNLETSKTMLIDQTWTARDIVSKMVKKNDVEVDPNWSLIERLPDMHLERIMEEHEHVLPVVFDWTRDTTNMLVFTKRRDKYTLFRNPQNFLLASGTSAGAAQLAEASKDILLEEFFTREHTRIPEVDGILWLREGKKAWQKHYFVLRASGVYYTPKGKTKASRDLICLVKFEYASVYLGIGMKKKYKAPTEHIFCLKHPKVQTNKSKHVYFLCAEDQKTMYQWVIAIRMAKYGYEMYDNYLQTQDNVEKELMLTNLANRGTASVKFQDEEEEFQERSGSMKRRTSASYKEGFQAKSSSLTRVKGQGTSNLGSLFSAAWKKGIDESVENLDHREKRGTFDGPEQVRSPEEQPQTFNVTNRAASISSKSSSGRGSFESSSSKASLKTSSSRGSLKSNGSLDEQPKQFILEPAPTNRTDKKDTNGRDNIDTQQSPLTPPPVIDFPPPPPPPPLKPNAKAAAPPQTSTPPVAQPLPANGPSVDELLSEMTDFLPPPPPSLMNRTPSPTSVSTPSPTFDFPPPPPPVPPPRRSSMSTRSTSSTSSAS